MKCYLYLDESGAFNGEQNQASIVAGYLCIDKPMPDEDAARILMSIKKKNPKFTNINITHFHGMEESDPSRNEYIVNVLEAFFQSRKDAKLIVFKNTKGYHIVNSDITYLNVFSDGIVELLEHLLLNSNNPTEKIDLSIYYARRVMINEMEITDSNSQNTIVQTPDDSAVQNKIKQSNKKIIAQTDYTQRIQEKIELRLAIYDTITRNRISYSIHEGSARNNDSLIIADMINFALRGGKKNFCKEHKNRLTALPLEKFSTRPSDNWRLVQKYLLENQIANALYAVFVEYTEDYSKRDKKEDFLNSLGEKMKQLNISTKRTQYQTVTQILSSLIVNRKFNRKFNLCDTFIDGILNEYIPFAKANGIYDIEFELDIRFFRLTEFTHNGNLMAAENEISICRKLFAESPFQLETLSYYIRYQIRETEHLKNAFDFDTVLKIQTKIKNTISDMIELIPMIDGINTSDKICIKSSDLCHVANSSLVTWCYLDHNPDNYKKALEDYSIAVKNAETNIDYSRIMSNMALLESSYGRFADALTYFANACSYDSGKPSKNEIPEQLPNLTEKISAIAKYVTDNFERKLFLLRDFLSIMSNASNNEPQIADMIYIQLKESGIFGKLLSHPCFTDYPGTIAVWNVASYLANKSDMSAKKYYQHVIENSLKNPQNATIYVQGLAAEAERIAKLQPTGAPLLRYLNLLNSNIETILQNDLPLSMRQRIQSFQTTISDFSNDHDRNKLLSASYLLPAI